MLCACSAGKLKWSDVEEKYLELQNSAANIAENASSFLSSDYKSLLDKFEENINNLQSGIGKDDTAAADTIFPSANKLIAEKNKMAKSPVFMFFIFMLLVKHRIGHTMRALFVLRSAPSGVVHETCPEPHGLPFWLCIFFRISSPP